MTQALDIDPAGPDAYEDDEDLDSANSITVNDPAPQRHNFHTSGDVDHIIFFARNVNDTKFGLGYTIQICPVNIQAGSALTAPTYLSTSSDYPLSSEFTNPTDC